MNEIPGAGMLGYGFNILGKYDETSITSRLFKYSHEKEKTYTYYPTNIEYAVPDNTTVISDTQTTGTAHVYSNRMQFQEYFMAKAGVKGSYWGFSTEFNAAYSQVFSTDQAYYYGLYDTDYISWEMQLADQSVEWISPSFLNDPAVKSLPSKYSKENQKQFFAIFRKYGTHVVTQVMVGGGMYYFVAVEQSYSSNLQQISANIELEYNAFFISGKAEAEIEWKNLGKTWAEKRNVKVDATGGDASLLNALVPNYGDNKSSAFSTWTSELMKNPAVIDFQLRPISILFSGDQQEAVSLALYEYLNSAVLVIANADYKPGKGPGGGDYTTHSGIIVNGKIFSPDPPVTPPPPYLPSGSDYIRPVGGVQIALFDPATLDPIMNHIYYEDQVDMSHQQQIYADIMEDIKNITADNYLCAVSGFAIDLRNYPTQDFVTWLASCGGALTEWKKYLTFSGYAGILSYVCIGKKGLMPGKAVESFIMTTNWYRAPNYSINTSGMALLYIDPSLMFIPEGAPKNLRALPVD